MEGPLVSILKPPTDDCWKHIGVWSRAEERCHRLQEVIHCRNCEVFTSAARGFYDRDLPADHLASWTPLYAAPKTVETDRTSHPVLIFRLGIEWLALPTTIVREVADCRPVHKVPHRSGVLRGLVNLNGRLEPCVSLHALLGVEPDPAPASKSQRTRPRLLLIGEEGQSFAFQADEVLGTHRYPPGKLRDIPATLAHSLARYSRGLIGMQQRTVGCLDEGLLFPALERTLA